MAYVNLIGQSCINPLETFCRFRDFVCKRAGTYDYSLTGIGWTLFDSYYAVNEDTISTNDYFVIYSNGENGDNEQYIHVKKTANAFTISGYLKWNATTHTGVFAYGVDNWTNTDATNNILWIYGDLDAVLGISKYSTIYYPGMFGWMPESVIDQTKTTVALAITAGSNVVVAFPSVPAGWAVGTKLFVRDGVNLERVNITVIDGLNVTFSAFVASYLADSEFSMEITNYTQGNNQAAYVKLQIGHSGTKDNSTTQDNITIVNPTSGDGLTGLYPNKQIYFSNATTWIGPLKNQLATLSGFTSETTHTIGVDGYRFFNLGFYPLISIRGVF